MLDQISFMDGLLELDALAGRIEHYTHIEGRFSKDGARIFLLLREALYRGVFERGEAGRIVGAGERTGRATLAKAVNAGLLKSDSPKSPVRLALPVKVLGAYFPRLFPADQLRE
jgi:Fic family protein